MPLPCGAMGRSVISDCGIAWHYGHTYICFVCNCAIYFSVSQAVLRILSMVTMKRVNLTRTASCSVSMGKRLNSLLTDHEN